MISGEEHAWGLLNDFSTEEICRRADVQFDPSTYLYTCESFGQNPEGFFDKGKKLGGSRQGYGDFSLQLYAFPRVPTLITIWRGDDEFPPNCSLLFDSTCKFHLPIDIIWATAFMTSKLMLRKDGN